MPASPTTPVPNPMQAAAPLPVLRLYNTLTRTIEPVLPREPGRITLYACGMTVYSRAHIGNLRKYLMDDLLVRTLRHAGYEVRHASNITDVGHLASDADEGEDKMEAGSRREGLSVLEIARKYEALFLQDCERLSILRPQPLCRATEHIGDMIALIAALEEKGFTYQAGGNLYFSIDRFPAYGALTGQPLDALRAGSRIEVDPHKRNPLDFVLWFTHSKFGNHALQWDSPWGSGYPGWHIECSAMALRHLGPHLDIHTGGVDHIPIHHTNEIAQSEAFLRHRWVGHWMHTDFLVTDGAKMSKSGGGIHALEDLVLLGAHPMDFRFMCLGTRYRKLLAFSPEALADAREAHQSLRRRVAALQKKADGERISTLQAQLPDEDDNGRIRQHADCFLAALLDDLNAPNALSALHAVVRDDNLSAAQRISLIGQFDRVLGLGLTEPLPVSDPKEPAWETDPAQEAQPNAEDLRMLALRDQARAERNWQEADRLRTLLLARGLSVTDGKDGTSRTRPAP